MHKGSKQNSLTKESQSTKMRIAQPALGLALIAPYL
jgi:hypothetical protein